MQRLQSKLRSCLGLWHDSLLPLHQMLLRASRKSGLRRRLELLCSWKKEQPYRNSEKSLLNDCFFFHSHRIRKTDERTSTGLLSRDYMTPVKRDYNKNDAIALGCLTQSLKHLVYDRGVASSNPIIVYWYEEFLCPVEPLYFSEEKSTRVEK